jgi:hypothetical protein
VHEDAAKAREEVVKARDDLTPLLVHVKELEEDVALVSGQRDALNVQIEMVSAHVGTLENEVQIADGFIMDPDRTDEENEAACLDLVEAAEELGGRLVKLFEVEVAPPANDEGCKPSLSMKAHIIG